MVKDGMPPTHKEYIDASCLVRISFLNYQTGEVEDIPFGSGVLCLEFKENDIPLNNKLGEQGK